MSQEKARLLQAELTPRGEVSHDGVAKVGSLVDRLCNAARYGRLEEVRSLLSKVQGVDLIQLVKAKDGKSRTALQWASAKGHSDVVRELLSKVDGTDLIELLKAKDDDKMTAAHWASHNGERGAMHELLEGMARTDVFAELLRECEKDQNHILHLAAWAGHLEVVQEILSWVDGAQRVELIKSRGYKSMTVLQISCGEDIFLEPNLDVVRELLGHVDGTELIDLLKAKDADSRTAIEIAASTGRFHVVLELFGYLDEPMSVEMFEGLLANEQAPELMDLMDALVIETETGSAKLPAEPIAEKKSKVETNVALPPDMGFLMASFFEQAQRAAKGLQFSWPKMTYCTRVELRLPSCERTLRALADTPNRFILGSTVATVIICHSWVSMFQAFMFDLCLQCVNLLLLFFLDSAWSRPVFIVLSALLVKRILEELFQCLTEGSYKYLISVGTCFDWLNITAKVAGLAAVWGSQGRSRSSLEVILISGMCFSTWMQVLYQLRGLHLVGPRLLPIFYAVSQLGVFFIIVMFVFLGTCHAYWTTQIYTGYYDIFVIILRAALFGDFDLLEMENRNTYYTEDDGGRWMPNDESSTENCIVVFLIFLAAAMGISMILMNILIGILSAEYDRFEGISQELFMQHRAQMICMYKTRQLLYAKLFCCCSQRRKPDDSDAEDDVLIGFVRADAGAEDEKSIRKAIQNDTKKLLDKRLIQTNALLKALVQKQS